MMPMRSLALALTALAAVGSHSTRASEDPDAESRARKSLEASAQAYRRVPALKDTLTYVIKTTAGTQPPKTLEVTLGANPDVGVKDALIEAIALQGMLYVTKRDAPDKYIAQPYSGDFAKSIEAVVGAQGWPIEPLQIAMRLGKGLDGWLKALRFGQLGPLQISGYEEKKMKTRLVEAIHFAAENGGIEADFDSKTHFLSRVLMRASPPGAPKDAFIEVMGEFSPSHCQPQGASSF